MAPDSQGRYSLSLFFPMYEEEGNAEQSVERALEVLPKFFGDFEVILVDDGSKDRTPEICDRLAAEHDAVRVVHHPENRGYGGAVKSGIQASTKELVFYTDGDLQFDLNELEAFLAELEHADVVVGYRKNRSDAPHRKLNAWLWNKLMWVALGLSYRDVDCAFKLFRRELLEAVGPLETDGAMISAELMKKLERTGARIVELGVGHYPRQAGESSGASPRVIFKAFRELGAMGWRLRSSRGPSGASRAPR